VVGCCAAAILAQRLSLTFDSEISRLKHVVAIAAHDLRMPVESVMELSNLVMIAELRDKLALCPMTMRVDFFPLPMPVSDTLVQRPSRDGEVLVRVEPGPDRSAHWYRLIRAAGASWQRGRAEARGSA
jgi:hypothetical protein